MSEILSVTGPIYLCIAAGYLSARLGLFSKSDMRVLGRFVFNIALPALLLNAVSQRNVAEILNPTYLAAYGLGSVAVIAIGYGLSRRLGRRGMAESAMAAMGLSCSNSGYIGYPILLLVMPKIAGVSVALNMIIENLVALPILLVLADREAHADLEWHGVARICAVRLARNPMVLAMVIGLALSLTGLRLPDFAGRAVGLFASASSAVSLFVVGGVLASSALHGMAGKVAPIAFGKLFGHPLAVYGAIVLVTRLGLPALEPKLLVAAVLMAAMPMLGIYTVLAQRYGQEDQSAAALLVTTTVSFFTLSGLLWLLKVNGALG
jgi:malonate transporter